MGKHQTALDQYGNEFNVPRKKSTRSVKKQLGKPQPLLEEMKPEFVSERSLPPITAKSQKQKDYLKMLYDPNIQVVIVLGLHGTGKTFCASAVAGDMFRQKKINNIIVSRAYVQTGNTSGFKPGTSLDKLYPYVRNVLDTIKKRIGDGAYYNALKDGVSGDIQVQEVESIRGRSFDEPGFLIIDEAQQTTPEEMKSITTRVSDQCKLVLCGDLRQCDIHGESGLEWFMKFAKRHNLNNVGIVDFDHPDDIIRGGLSKAIAIGLAKDQQKESN